MSLYIAFFVLFLILFYYKRKVVLYSTVDIFVLFFSLVVFFTVIYHYYVPENLKFNFYNFDDIHFLRFERTIVVFLKMLYFFYFGSLIFKILNPNLTGLKVSSDAFKIKKSINLKLLSKALIILLVLSLFLVFIDYGFEIFKRSKYIPEKSSSFKTVYQILFIFISFFSGLLYKKNFKLSIFSLVTTLLIGLSLGSRFASLYLIFFGITLVIQQTSKVKRNLFLLWFIPFVLFFFGFNISLRTESNTHGLIPYFSTLYNKPYIIYEYTLQNIYYSFVFGFYATADTIKEYSFYSIDKLIVCLNPLPGKLTSWYSFANKLRSNIYAPFTAIGELAKFKYFFFVYYCFLGYYFSLVDFHIKKSLNKRNYMLPVFQILILSMFIIFSFEYNLRSSNRYIYYSIIVLIIYLYLRNYRFIYKNSSNEL